MIKKGNRTTSQPNTLSLKGRDPMKVFEIIPNITDLVSKYTNPFQQDFRPSSLEYFARIAKYNLSIKERFLEMITEPDKRVYEGFTDGHPPLDWRMPAIAALQHQRVLPSDIWDEYREQVVEYIISKGHMYCMWRDILPNEEDDSKYFIPQ